MYIVAILICNDTHQLHTSTLNYKKSQKCYLVTYTILLLYPIQNSLIRMKVVTAYKPYNNYGEHFLYFRSDYFFDTH